MEDEIRYVNDNYKEVKFTKGSPEELSKEHLSELNKDNLVYIPRGKFFCLEDCLAELIFKSNGDIPLIESGQAIIYVHKASISEKDLKKLDDDISSKKVMALDLDGLLININIGFLKVFVDIKTTL